MENNSENYLQEVMDLFMARYQPVDDIKDATHFLSTGEIHTEITGLNPGCKVKSEHIRQKNEGTFKLSGIHYIG